MMLARLLLLTYFVAPLGLVCAGIAVRAKRRDAANAAARDRRRSNFPNWVRACARPRSGRVRPPIPPAITLRRATACTRLPSKATPRRNILSVRNIMRAKARRRITGNPPSGIAKPRTRGTRTRRPPSDCFTSAATA